MLKTFLILVSAIVCLADIPYPGKSPIVRPCHLSNYKCIRDNLAANSYCNKGVKGTIPSKYLVSEFRFEAPYFNASYIDQNLIVKNHDKCFVSEFYFNIKTKKAVLGIDCPHLDLESDRVLIQHRSLKEDSNYFYHIRALYPLIRLTVNLPSSTHMDLCQANVYTDVVVPPIFKVDPKDKPTENFLTTDLKEDMVFERESFFYRGYTLSNYFVDTLLYKRTADFLSTDLSEEAIFERENFYYRGYPLARIFIDSILCDFGCPPHIL